jgi:hypothetical protein
MQQGNKSCLTVFWLASLQSRIYRMEGCMFPSLCLSGREAENLNPASPERLVVHTNTILLTPDHKFVYCYT